MKATEKKRENYAFLSQDPEMWADPTEAHGIVLSGRCSGRKKHYLNKGILISLIPLAGLKANLLPQR